MISSERLNLYYSILNHLFSLSIDLITALGFVVICRGFMREKRRALIIGLPYLVINEALQWTDAFIPKPPILLVSILLTFVVFWALDPRNIRCKIFLMMTCFSVKWTAFAVVGWIHNVFYQYASDFFLGGIDLTRPDFWRPYLIFFAAADAVEALACAAAYFLAIKLLLDAFKNKERELDKSELWVLAVPSIVGMGSYAVLHLYSDRNEGAAMTYIFDSRPVTGLVWSVFLIFLLISVITTIRSCENLWESRIREQDRLLLAASIEDMRSHIERVDEVHAKLRGVRHEINNHITVLDELLKNDRTDEAREYLDSFTESVRTTDFPVKTGNPVTDVIIGEKLAEAKARGIEFACEYHHPVGINIDVFDISIILSNALSNALEAAESCGEEGCGDRGMRAGSAEKSGDDCDMESVDRGYVKVSSAQKKNACLITVENSFTGVLDIDRQSGLPLTTKADKASHGLGLRNMKAVAEKYNGGLSIRQQGNFVLLTVMLMAGE